MMTIHPTAKRIAIHLALTLAIPAAVVSLASCGPIGSANPLDRADDVTPAAFTPGGYVLPRSAGTLSVSVPPVIPAAPCTVATP